MPRDAEEGRPRRPKGNRASAHKQTFNPPAGGRGEPPFDGAEARSQTRGPEEQDPKRRIGQHSGRGEPPLMKK
jgi:hypothetical protein